MFRLHITLFHSQKNFKIATQNSVNALILENKC